MKIVKIPKKKGGFRTIYVPEPEHKAAYRAFVRQITPIMVQHCKYCHGFMPGKSAITAAKKHIPYKITICWDIKDFFDSVTKEMVSEFIPEHVLNAVLIDGAPRQGLPTSPLVANLAASKLDSAIASAVDGVYTRYADDLTISFNDERLISNYLKIIPEIVKAHGFEIATGKTRVQFSLRRRYICGVGIDLDIPNTIASRKARRNLRAAKYKASLSLKNREKFKANANGLEEWCRQRLPVQAILDDRTGGRGFIIANDLGISKLRLNRKKLRQFLTDYPVGEHIKARNFLSSNKMDVEWTIGLIATFGSNWRNWLSSSEYKSVHDLCYWLPSDISTSDGLGKKLFIWRKTIEDFPSRINEISFIAKKWSSFTQEEKKLSLNELLSLSKISDYGTVKHRGFAFEAANAGVLKQDYSELENKWLNCVKSLTHESIPFVGFVHNGYSVYHLSKSSPVIPWVGHYTNCCQHIEGVARTSAWHSVSSPEGGVLVIERKGEIIAQSWLWRNGNILVADNCEAKSNEKDLPELYDLWASKVLGKLEIKEVRIGGRGDINLKWPVINSVEKPFNCYSDATTQHLIKSYEQEILTHGS